MNALSMTPEPGTKPVFCRLPFQQIKVDADGSVSMCCYQSGILGNLLDQSFKELWTSPLADQIRTVTQQGRLHSMCKGWGGCPFIFNEKLPDQDVSKSLSWPQSLEFDLPNTHCNIGGISPKPETACIMCPRSSKDFTPHSDLTQEIAGQLRWLMPHLREIRILGLAEPFWKGKVFDVLDWMGFFEYRHACHFNTFTNGSVFTADARRRFIETCPNSRLFFSIDAASRETYMSIRRLDLFDRVTTHIKAFVSEKTQWQFVGISNNLNMLNIHEAIQMVELANDLGVRLVMFNPTHQGGVARPDLDSILVSKRNANRFKAAQENISRRGRELGIKIEFARPLDLGLARAARSFNEAIV